MKNDSKSNVVKGFHNCKRIKIKINDKDEEIVVTKHFENKIMSEPLSISLKKGGIEKAIYESIVITARPRNVYILIKNNFRDAIYLYHNKSNSVMVLEEDTLSKEYRILKTAYRANNSGWIEDWLNATPRYKRVSFNDYFIDRTLKICEG